MRYAERVYPDVWPFARTDLRGLNSEVDWAGHRDQDAMAGLAEQE